MPAKDPQERLRELYSAGLAECGFTTAQVVKGLQMLESDRYFGFADVVTSLSAWESQPAQRAHTVARIVEQVSACEARAGAEAATRRAASEAAARAVEESLDRDERVREALADLEDLRRFGAEVTDDELDLRAPMRPHIAEMYRRLFDQEPPPAGPSRRPSWIGRAPGPRIREAVPAGGAAAGR